MSAPKEQIKNLFKNIGTEDQINEYCGFVKDYTTWYNEKHKTSRTEEEMAKRILGEW